MRENPTKNQKQTLLEKSVIEVPKRSLEKQEGATERALPYFNQVTDLYQCQKTIEYQCNVEFNQLI